MKFVSVVQHRDKVVGAYQFDSFEEARDSLVDAVSMDARALAPTKNELAKGLNVAEQIRAQTESFTLKIEDEDRTSFYSVVKLRGLE